ncbi:hypothetical protein ACFGWN_12325 [Pasteurella multocida]|uniref:hypothetical protein n=1 Tax=Pasteurella multocida TaxID=747 RepID=UPI0009F5F6DD|nr:hypothetical protein [Pasteurella multocida]PNM06764.1 hypothetical protein A6J89_000075 [Pasteurella multocida]
MFRVFFITIVLFSNNAFAKVGDICHAQGGLFYYGGVIEKYEDREVCNFWKFLNLEEMMEEERYIIEDYIDTILNGAAVDDSEYDFSEDVIIDDE